MADRARTNSLDSLFSKMCFACRKTSLRAKATPGSFRNSAVFAHPVQLGVTMPKKTSWP